MSDFNQQPNVPIQKHELGIYAAQAADEADRLSEASREYNTRSKEKSERAGNMNAQLSPTDDSHSKDDAEGAAQSHQVEEAQLDTGAARGMSAMSDENIMSLTIPEILNRFRPRVPWPELHKVTTDADSSTMSYMIDHGLAARQPSPANKNLPDNIEQTVIEETAHSPDTRTPAAVSKFMPSPPSIQAGRQNQVATETSADINTTPVLPFASQQRLSAVSNNTGPSIQERKQAAQASTSLSMDVSHDHSQSVDSTTFRSLPSLKLDLNQCLDRCGHIVFSALAPMELGSEWEKHRLELGGNLMPQLERAAATYLGISPDDNHAGILQVRQFTDELYEKAREELRAASQYPGQFPPVSKSPSVLYDQLTCIMRVMRDVDKKLRPEPTKDDAPTFEASLKIAAMKWQRDIHAFWIQELSGNHKRKSHGGEEPLGPIQKYQRTRSDTTEGSAPKRRPGRPPGAKNKTTIAVVGTKAHGTQSATRSRSEIARAPGSPTPLPRSRHLQLAPADEQRRQAAIAANRMDAQRQSQTRTGPSLQNQAQQHSHNPNRLQHSAYHPSSPPSQGSSVNAGSPYQQQGRALTSHSRRNAISKQDGSIDPSTLQHAHSLSETPSSSTTTFNTTINNNFYGDSNLWQDDSMVDLLHDSGDDEMGATDDGWKSE